MLVECLPSVLVPEKNNVFQIQKRFAYYRFHKRVGKGSWTKYVERYKLPRSIENTQRLIFNYEGTYSEKKLSSSWQWMLPKKIAQATTSDEVLNVWVYYRHKRKKAYHYMKVLKRLVDVGSCPTSDWRFKLITSRIQNKINTFLNLPRICYYYGILRATAQIENLSKMLNHRLNCYLPHQLILILRGFSLCKLQDKYLFNRIRDLLQPHIRTVSFHQLVLILQSYSSCLIHDFLFFEKLSNEAMHRMSLCSHATFDASYRYNMSDYTMSDNDASDDAASDHGEEGRSEYYIGGDTENAPLQSWEIEDARMIKIKQEHFSYYPSMSNLVDIAYYFSSLKFQNYPIYDQLSMYVMYMLKSGNNCLNPYFIEKIVISFCKIKINDIVLFEHILKHIDVYIYDYPPSVLSSIGCCFSSILPLHYSPIYRIYKKMLLHVHKNMHILNLDALTKYTSFVHRGTLNRELKREILLCVNEQIKRKENRNSKITYDVPRMMEVLSYHNCIDETSFNILCKHMHGNIKYFEPYDFNRGARALRNVKRKLNISDEKIVNSITRNVIREHDLFHTIDYYQTANSLLQINTMKDIYKIYITKHHNNIPFYGFDELKMDYDLPEEPKKSIYRYKKGTIYYSNKRIQQQYPPYKSVEDLH
ncbi:conserved Plasmodium protein, unknown function [Plasmodium ovale]|uniref:RAP domain-containing protein n=2 Tax=Plasmodium ovale TaxID=36330 RepID=A0A1A8VR31_PLAOA|nr:conserved Plasmodium protein, unknown function [Plasmodium ovale curtisi]SCP04212.1 conserved Plasmodium protein, unknown function [Plasmodium ovale]